MCVLLSDFRLHAWIALESGFKLPDLFKSFGRFSLRTFRWLHENAFYVMGTLERCGCRMHSIVVAVATLGNAVSFRCSGVVHHQQHRHRIIGILCAGIFIGFHHGQFMTPISLLCAPSSGSCFLFKLLWRSFSFSFCPPFYFNKRTFGIKEFIQNGENLFTKKSKTKTELNPSLSLRDKNLSNGNAIRSWRNKKMSRSSPSWETTAS